MCKTILYQCNVVVGRYNTKIFEASVQCEEDTLGMYCFSWALENWMPLVRGWSSEVSEKNTSILVGLVRGFVVSEIVPRDDT